MPSWTALRVAGNVLWCFLRHGLTLPKTPPSWWWRWAWGESSKNDEICSDLEMIQSNLRASKPFDGSKPKSLKKQPEASQKRSPWCSNPKRSTGIAHEVMPSLVILPDTVSYSLGSDQWPWASALLQAPRETRKGVERRVKDCISFPTLRSICIHLLVVWKGF